MDFKIKSIGIVHSPIKKGIDYNWGKVISEIHIFPEFIQGLKGLNEFSHIIVLFYMHKSSFDLQHDLLRHPRGREDLPLVGIFTQRAKHRPNPIGVTIVKLVDLKEGILVIKGLDAIDGTPVIDLKPYVPVFDHARDVVIPTWMNSLMEDYF